MHPPAPFFAPPMPQNDQQARIVALIFLTLWIIALLYFRYKSNSQSQEMEEEKPE
jgi:hypothetical protein